MGYPDLGRRPPMKDIYKWATQEPKSILAPSLSTTIKKRGNTRKKGSLVELMSFAIYENEGDEERETAQQDISFWVDLDSSV